MSIKIIGDGIWGTKSVWSESNGRKGQSFAYIPEDKQERKMQCLTIIEMV